MGNQLDDDKADRKADRSGAITEDLRSFIRMFVGMVAVVLLGVIAYAIATSPGFPGSLLKLGAAVLIIAFHALCGGLLGFLFAIPRSRQQEPAVRERVDNVGGDQVTATAGAAAGTRRKLSDYSANTNLEQISDWLTKILVGAGLVQLKEIGGQMGALASVLAPALGDSPTSRPVVLCLMGFGLCWGFFFAYLVTRLWLPRALSRAESDEEIQQLEVARQAQRQKMELERETELSNLERRTYNFLYEKPPGGYSRAIEEIEHYNAKPGAFRSGWLYLYLACAYGQRHAYENPAKDSEKDQELRKHVRAAAEEAIRLSSSTKAVLQRIYEAGDPGEDDLKSLNPDPRLEELLR